MEVTIRWLGFYLGSIPFQETFLYLLLLSTLTGVTLRVALGAHEVLMAFDIALYVQRAVMPQPWQTPIDNGPI